MNRPAVTKIDQVQYSSASKKTAIGKETTVLCTIQAMNGAKLYGVATGWGNSTEEQLRERAYETAFANLEVAENYLAAETQFQAARCDVTPPGLHEPITVLLEWLLSRPLNHWKPALVPDVVALYYIAHNYQITNLAPQTSAQLERIWKEQYGL